MARAQGVLGRVQRGSEAASGEGGGKKAAVEARLEAERRVGSADYVGARGLVQPACEYLERAVRAAGVQKVLSGD